MINQVLTKITNYYKNNGYCLVVSLCIFFIIFIGLINIFLGKSGSVSDQYTYYTGMNSKHLLSAINDIDKGFRNDFSGVGDGKDSKGERQCRRVLQHVFDKPFNKSRPYFLNNEVTGGSNNLELDCFDKELRLAVEYNGIQHYKYTPYFHKNKEVFETQKYRDYMKKVKCQENGINLIIVPYTVKLKDIQHYLYKELRALKYI